MLCMGKLFVTGIQIKYSLVKCASAGVKEDLKIALPMKTCGSIIFSKLEYILINLN